MDNLYVPRMVWRVLCEEIIKRLGIKTLNIFKWWGGSIKSFAPFCFLHLIIRDIHEKETKENPPYAPTLYSGSSLCYSIHWNIPPYLLDIYLKLLSQIVILYFISFNLIIPLEYPSFDSFLSILDFNLSSHWNLPLSIYLFDDLMNYPIGFYLSLFKYRFRFLNYSFWWFVPLSLDF